MKKLVLGIVAVVLFGVFAFAAVKILIIDSRTVGSTDDILALFYETRSTLPPLPSPVNYQDVMGQLSEGRFDFVASPGWAFNHDGGTYYLAEKSKLARQIQLPAKLLAYEDLSSGSVVLAAIPEATGKLQQLAAVAAPGFAPLEAGASVEKYLMQELWPRRVIWQATLEPEASVFSGLVQPQQATPMMLSEPMATAVPPPEEFKKVEDYRFNLVGPEYEGGTNTVGWYGVRGFTYQLRVTDDLAHTAFHDDDGAIAAVAGTNGPAYKGFPSDSAGFFKVEATAEDGDSDGLLDFWEYRHFPSTAQHGTTDDPDLDGLTNEEEYDTGTHPKNKDTDGDGMWDGFEVYYGFDPTNGAVHQLNGNGKGIGPEDDFDDDGVLNIDEHDQGALPHLLDDGFEADEDRLVKWFGQLGWCYQLQEADFSGGPWTGLGPAQVGRNREISVDVGQGQQTWFRIMVAQDQSDPDMDGLSNADELASLTDPYKSDTDNDGMGDGYEIYYEFDPLEGAAFLTNIEGKGIGPKDDFDDDGITNLDEHNQGTFTDHDGLNLNVTDNTFEWFGHLGWHYQLQEADFSGGPWTGLGESFVGDNDVISVNPSSYAKPYLRVAVVATDLASQGSYLLEEFVTYGTTSYGCIRSVYEVDRTVNTASAGYNGGTANPINGKLRIPEGDGPFPLAIVVHGQAKDYSKSEEGFKYLCNQLASHGVIAASIDENLLRYNNEDEIAARALVLLEHVKQFNIWNETDEHPLENRINMGKVMLLGHSRGGEALEHASFFNRLGPTEADPETQRVFDGTPDNYELGPYGFDIQALVAIAPTEGRYPHPNSSEIIRRTIRDNYFIIQGSSDGDIYDFKGYRTYERAHPVDLEDPLKGAEGCKALLWIHGANHNQFNDNWLWDDERTGPDIISPEMQEDIAKYYVTAIAYAKLYGCDFGLSPFRDNRIENTTFTNIALVTQFQDATRRLINHYDDDDDPTTLSDPHAGTNSWSCTLSETNFLNDVQKFQFPAPATNYAACMQLTNSITEYVVDLDVSLDASSYNALSFRIAQDYATGNNAGISIEVGDDGAAAANFPLTNYATVWPPTETCWNGRLPRVVLQTVRIPLAEMEEVVDIRAIKRIKLKLPSSVGGVVYLDDLHLSK